MASPPFNINQALPGDSDIVSQHPTNARAMRDIVESWLLVNHDTNGNHARVDIPRTASPTTPAASIDVLYTTTTGRLKIKHPDATEEFVGLPPGVIVYGAGSLDVGYLEADGSAVSRVTFADLFTKLGISYGAGDGSTTFNLPNIAGRVIAAKEATATLLTTAGSGVDGATMGSVGGTQNAPILQANLPIVNFTTTGTVSLFASGVAAPLGIIAGNVNTSAVGGGAVTPYNASAYGTLGASFSNGFAASGGSGTVFKLVQPTIVLRAMIKY